MYCNEHRCRQNMSRASYYVRRGCYTTLYGSYKAEESINSMSQRKYRVRRGGCIHTSKCRIACRISRKWIECGLSMGSCMVLKEAVTQWSVLVQPQGQRKEMGVVVSKGKSLSQSWWSLQIY